MSFALKLGIDFSPARYFHRLGWVRRLNRRLASTEVVTKCFSTAGLIGLVGYADLLSGNELSFSIFYLLPITYATWFIRAKAGALAALICAVVWFTVEVNNHGVYSHHYVPVWNAAVRLVFFLLGVSVAALVKRTEVELLREVSRRTRTLRTEAERRRRLEREMIEVSAREQVRLAQDLHDGLGQYLSAMAFHARMLTDDLRQQRSLHTQQAERIVELIRLTNQVTRRLDRALRVPEAGEGGLFAAIRALAGEFEQLTGVRCELETVESPIVLDEFRTLMVFRIVQEAFNNAVKHSNPRVIRVGFLTGDHTMVVRVVHDGEGIPVKPEREPGTGLRIMKLRAELIGAILDIGPVESGGYQVKCVLPLSSRELKVQGGCP